MKALIIFLILSTAFSVVKCTVDYCEVEKRLCEPNQKHIGCEKNEFPDSVYQLKTMTNELKKIILDEINSFRSFIATGQQSQFETASNMRLVTWNNEMEFISGQLVKKRLLPDTTCIKIDFFPIRQTYGSYMHINAVPSDFIKRVFKDLFKKVIENLPKEQLEYSRFYSANLTNIGCGFGIYQKSSMILKCLTSVDDPPSFSDTYRQGGNPCSNCSALNQFCSKKYPGLCEDCLNGEKCEKEIDEGLSNGEKGVDGHNIICKNNSGISEKVEAILIALCSSLIVLFVLILIILLIILFIILKNKSSAT